MDSVSLDFEQNRTFFKGFSALDVAQKNAGHIDQWRSHLIIFWRTTKGANKSLYKKMGIRDALKKGITRLITVTSSGDGVDAYLDGRPVRQFSGVSLPRNVDSLFGKTLLVGNSLDGTRSWSGDIFGVGLYTSALSTPEVEKSYKWWTQESKEKPPFASGAIAVYRFDKQAGRVIPNMVDRGTSLNTKIT